MKLEKLRSSISMSASEKPNLYSALCLVETLFRDLKDESGLSIQMIPEGDEMLPTKLVWLCRTVLEIYNENKDNFTRSSQLLEKKIAELTEMNGELGDTAVLVSELSQKKKNLEEETKKRQKLKTESEELNQDLLQVEQEITDGKNKLEALKSKKDQKLQEKCWLTETRSKLEASLPALNDELEELKAQNQAYDAENLAPVRNKIEAQKQENQANIDEFDSLNAQLEKLEQKKAQMIFSISQTENKINETQKAIDQQSQTITVKKATIEGLSRKLEEQKEELKRLAEEVSTLNDQLAKMDQDDLPQARALRTLKKDELSKITDRCSECEKENEELQSKINDLTSKCAEYEKKKLEYQRACEELQRLQPELSAAASPENVQRAELVRKKVEMLKEAYHALHAAMESDEAIDLSSGSTVRIAEIKNKIEDMNKQSDKLCCELSKIAESINKEDN